MASGEAGHHGPHARKVAVVAIGHVKENVIIHLQIIAEQHALELAKNSSLTAMIIPAQVGNM